MRDLSKSKYWNLLASNLRYKLQITPSHDQRYQLLTVQFVKLWNSTTPYRLLNLLCAANTINHLQVIKLCMQTSSNVGSLFQTQQCALALSTPLNHTSQFNFSSPFKDVSQISYLSPINNVFHINSLLSRNGVLVSILGQKTIYSLSKLPKLLAVSKSISCIGFYFVFSVLHGTIWL